jgi:hypothetical protein
VKGSSSVAIGLALCAIGCMGPHIDTGPTPATPAEAFACMTQAVQSLGYTITTSQSAQGFLAAEKRDLSSPDSSEYSELTVSVYKNDDGKTQYLISGGRAKATPDGQRTTFGVMVLDADGQAADEVVKRCGAR